MAPACPSPGQTGIPEQRGGSQGAGFVLAKPQGLGSIARSPVQPPKRPEHPELLHATQFTSPESFYFFSLSFGFFCPTLATLTSSLELKLEKSTLLHPDQTLKSFVMM